MGGGRKIPYPKWVWAPSGGFYGAQQNNPSNWKFATALVLGAMGASVSAIWRISDRNTVEYKRPELVLPKRSGHGHH
jgi:hypothetical protein